MENCYPHDSNGYHDHNTTTTDQTSLAICNFPNSTDICAVVALCVAERIGYAIAIPAIACVGILLNIFNLIVLTTNRFPESSYTYLAALAVADLLSLCVFAVNGIGRGYYPDVRAWRIFEVYFYFPVGFSTTTASILLTVTVTVERYVFIYHPIKSKTLCNQATARRVVAVLALLSVAINIPRFFSVTVDSDNHLSITDFGRSQRFCILSWIYLSLISLAPGFCLIFFNALLIVGIRRTGRKRKTLVGGKKMNKNREEATLTRTLIIVVCVFIAGELPSAFTSRSLVVGLISHGDQSLLLTTGYRIAVLVSTILVVLQYSLNFVVYCVFNRRFCAVLRHHYLSMLLGSRSQLGLHVVNENKTAEGNGEKESSLHPTDTFV